MLLSYRQQCVLAPLEEAWAWWHSVDCLALQRKDHLMMEEQKRFFLFAQQHFFPEHCLFVCSDSTQARSWLMQQQEEEWLALCVSLLEKVKRNDETRYDRFLLLRSMVTILLRNASPDRFGRIEDVLITITDMLQENRGWPRHEELFLEATALQIQVLNMSDGANESHLRQLGVQASSRVDAMARHMSGMAQTRVIRRLAHNIGGDLFFAHQYDLAIPLLEQARALGSTSSYTALWLAASLRALKQREQQVQALLQEVAIFSHDVSLQQQMSSLPELQC